MTDLVAAVDDTVNEASKLGRAALETCLERLAPEVREAFWNAIGLYYSTRRHPGAEPPAAVAQASATA